MAAINVEGVQDLKRLFLQFLDSEVRFAAYHPPYVRFLRVRTASCGHSSAMLAESLFPML